MKAIGVCQCVYVGWGWGRGGEGVSFVRNQVIPQTVDFRVSYIRNQVVTTNTTTVVMQALTANALLPENTTHAWFSLISLSSGVKS